MPMPTAVPPAAVLPLLKGDDTAPRRLRLAMLVAWLALAGWLVARHVMWRDEVRALSLAVSGDSVGAMLRNLQGEGHPALWYLLLRAGHAVAGDAALPGIAFAIGAGAAALFAWRAPFRPLVVALVLFGAYTLNEYTVLARNYGVAMLVMFAFACTYGRWRDRGIGLGLLLALLCNTNVPAVLLAGALALFWGIDILSRDGWRWTPAWRHWTLNMGVALIGVIACVAEVYPPYNDAAVSPLAGRMSVATVVLAAFNITAPLSALVPEAWWDMQLSTLFLAALVVGSVLGLIRSPGGLVAALVAMIALPLFFQLVYPGGYRHQALFVVFLLTLYWLVAAGHGGRWHGTAWLRPVTQGVMQRAGQGAFLALLLTQVVIALGLIATAASGTPYSRSRDLAALLRREGLDRAVVIANPDVLVEALPYYADHPQWLLRERRWGRVVAFTRAAAASAVTLDGILATARRLRAETGRPVAIVMQIPLDPRAPPQTWEQGYLGTVSTTPAAVRAFLAGTRRLARFGPAQTDESYDVYLLDGP